MKISFTLDQMKQFNRLSAEERSRVIASCDTLSQMNDDEIDNYNPAPQQPALVAEVHGKLKRRVESKRRRADRKTVAHGRSAAAGRHERMHPHRRAHSTHRRMGAHQLQPLRRPRPRSNRHVWRQRHGQEPERDMENDHTTHSRNDYPAVQPCRGFHAPTGRKPTHTHSV